ncbi:MAG: hypothetical protein DMG67_04940 [Acidobacteria bacterium]|nr:MAG: hypothetical protein DMG67_04940 [Acidobacteriota bacterium]
MNWRPQIDAHGKYALALLIGSYLKNVFRKGAASEVAEKHVLGEITCQGTSLLVPEVAEKSYFLAAAGLRVAKRSAQNKRFSAASSAVPKSRGRWVLPILSGLMLVVGAAAQEPAQKAAQQRDTAEQHFHSAQTFQLAGDYEKSAAEYREAIARALQHLGNLRVSQGKYTEGIDLLETAAHIQPKYSDAAIDLAIAQLQSGALAKSKPLVEDVLKQDRANFRALNLMGKIYFIEGDFQKAADDLQAALKLEPDFDVAYSLALADLKLKKIVEANVLFDEMLASIKPSAELHALIGVAYRETGYLDQAVTHFAKAVSLDAKHPHAHASLALTYLLQGPQKYTEAGEQFEAELAIDPDDYASNYFLGIIRLREHKLAEAEKWFDQATKLRPDDPDAFFNLGQAYLEQGAFEKVIPILQKSVALSKDPGHNDFQVARAHEMLGQAWQELGKEVESASEKARAKQVRSGQPRSAQAPSPEGAVDNVAVQVGRSGQQELRTVLMKTPANAASTSAQEAEYVRSVSQWVGDAYHNLGVIDARGGRFQDAVAEFQHAAHWNSNIEALDRNWGVAAFRANLYQEAILPLERQLRRKPDDMRVREMLGLSYFMTDKFAESAKMLGPISDQLPNDPALLYAAGVSLVRTGDVKHGGEVFSRMLEQNANVPEVHLMLAKAYAEQAEYEQAQAEISRALELNPKLGEAHYHAGMVYFKQGRLEDAMRELQAELSLNPRYVPAMYQLAYVRIAQHEMDEAIHLLTDVIAQQPSYADAYYQLGKAMLEKGDLKGAIQNLETRQGRNDEAERALQKYQELTEKRQTAGNPKPQN